MDLSVHGHVSEAAENNINLWLSEPKYSEYKQDLEDLIRQERWEDLEDAFHTKVAFGTAGIRGATGLGSARISKVSIGEAAQALCAYVKHLDQSASEKGIVIAFDTRLTSDEFSKLAASVCAGNGFKVYIFDGYRSTPELSFAVRHLNAAAGIVISASHNPPTDNGFKAYMSDGGQLLAPHDIGVVSEVAKIQTIVQADYEASVESGLITIIGSDVDDAYIAAVLAESESSERDLSIVYSPLHGAGQRNTLPVLRQAGFDIAVVSDQMVPDGNFPTVENNKPNPEERAANDLAVALMMSSMADIAITNDPDADRIGVIVRQSEEPKYLSGNQSAALATEFALKKLAEKGAVTANHYIAKTIVTTELLTAIADRYGAKVYGDMLIGFKYIGELLLQKEQTNESFIIGAEESFGLLKGDYARDKDGSVGALVLAEYAAELKKEGKTLYDRLLEMYQEYGYYTERLDTIVCPGASGFTQMKAIMAKLRTSPPSRIGSHSVTAISDYQTLKRRTSDGAESDVTCRVKGDVVVLECGDPRRRITIRPSGTEPKLKLYVQWYDEAEAKEMNDIETRSEELEDQLVGISKELEGMLLAS